MLIIKEFILLFRGASMNRGDHVAGILAYLAGTRVCVEFGAKIWGQGLASSH